MKKLNNQMATQKVGLILLAAGKSTRAHNFNKLARKINGMPMLVHCYNAIKNSQVDQVIIVTSKENYQLTQNLEDPSPEVILISQNSKGLGYSLSRGIIGLHYDISSAIICLADTPFISKTHINLLIDLNKRNNYNGILRLIDVNNKPGHPVLFNADLFPELEKLRSDEDPKNFINNNKHLLYKVKVTDSSPTRDFDTEEDWVKLKTV